MINTADTDSELHNCASVDSYEHDDGNYGTECFLGS
jgi:hypothetical protein